LAGFVSRGPYGSSVPRISFFYGITIWMYWNEGAHARPHFHARNAGQAASVDFAGELIAGSHFRGAHSRSWPSGRPSITTSCSPLGAGSP
jgi:hypothetical protein